MFKEMRNTSVYFYVAIFGIYCSVKKKKHNADNAMLNINYLYNNLSSFIHSTNIHFFVSLMTQYMYFTPMAFSSYSHQEDLQVKFKDLVLSLIFLFFPCQPLYKLNPQAKILSILYAKYIPNPVTSHHLLNYPPT